MIRYIFLVFSTLVFFINSSLLVFAQESLNSDIEQPPEVSLNTVYIEKLEYSTGEKIIGTVNLKNKRGFDTSDIYLTISLTGSNDETLPLRKYEHFDISDPVGPYFLEANEEKQVIFEYQLPEGMNPSDFIALSIRATLENGTRLGTIQKEFKITGDKTGYLKISDTKIIVGEEEFSLTQSPTVYSNEEAYVSYSINNQTNDLVKLTPLVTIYEKREREQIVARYEEDPVTVLENSEEEFLSSIRLFDNDPGIYYGQIELLDSKGGNVTRTIVFDYVVDGNIATIESIILPDRNLRKGEDFLVFINYSGKPVDIRDITSNHVVRNVSVVVEVKNDVNKQVAYFNEEMDLDIRGQLKIPMTAKISANGLNVNVKFIKDGEILNEDMINLPPDESSTTSPLVIAISGIVLILLAIAYLFIQKFNKHLVALIGLIAFGLFGFSSQVSAYTIVYTAGDSEVSPTNIVVTDPSEIYGPFNVYSESTAGPIGISVSLPSPTSGPEYFVEIEERAVYSLWTGLKGGDVGEACKDPSCYGNTDIWYGGQPATLIASEDNLNKSLFSQGNSWPEEDICTDSCADEFDSDLATPSDSGSYRLYLYIVNEYYVYPYDSEGQIDYDNGDFVYSRTLLYEDIEFFNPTEDNENPSCYASVTSTAFGSNVTWTYSPGVCADIASPSCNQDFGIENGNLYLKWGGDFGSNPVGSQSYTNFPYEIEEFQNDPDTYCQENYNEPRTHQNGQCCYEEENYECTTYRDCYTGDNGEQVCDNTQVCDYVTNTVCDSPYDANLWGDSLTTSYSQSDINNGEAAATLLYYDAGNQNSSHSSCSGQCNWQDENDWRTLSCGILEVIPANEDVCPNISGIQAEPPSGFHVYPSVDQVGQNGVTYADLICYPLTLAQQGSIDLSASPNPSAMNQNVTWTYTLSDSFFEGILDGVTYQIPRFATVLWSGDTTNSAFLSGNSNNIESQELLGGTTDSLNVSYSSSGSAQIDITITDPYLSVTDNANVTIQDEEGCPGSPGCDDGGGGIAEISDFNIDPALVNDGEQCQLAWTTSSGTESCTLSSLSGDISVATSSSGYAVDPGQYQLVCQDNADPINEVESETLSCVLNPDVQER